MALNKSSSLCNVLPSSLFLFIVFFSSSMATSPETVCRSTPYPDFCNSTLPHDKPQRTVSDYGKISLRQSLSHAQNTLPFIQHYLTHPSNSSVSFIRALEDCQVLFTLNIDFFSQTLQTLISTTSLSGSQADDLHTLISAVITNLQTCSDGIEVDESGSSDIKNSLRPSFNNGTKFYSVSLAIFKLAWVPDRRTSSARWLRETELLFSQFGKNRKLLHAAVGANVSVSQKVVVNPNGSGNFTTISDAVNAAPNNTVRSGNTTYFVIYVVAGVYQEYVSIPSYKQNLMMIGDGINRTVITGNHSVADGWTTFSSATFAVVGQGFVAINITFRNTAGAIKNQAVAVRNSADLSAFYSCSIEGYQDTLYTHILRQFYRECDIYGTVDFIFGNAAVVFQNSNIYPRQPLQGQSDTITAQGRTDVNQNTGTSIQNCSIKAANDLAASNFTVQTYLGRPWKQYSRTVYMQSFMNSLINSAGWLEWNGTFALDTLYYAEYNNSGPGSKTSQRVNWSGYHVINATDAVNFTVSNFISGGNWLPAIGVPYTGGLI